MHLLHLIVVVLTTTTRSKEDIDDVRREVQIMHHLAGDPNVVKLKGAYEDKAAVHLVMELCAGGELFDRIVAKGSYSEKDAAAMCRTIVKVVAHCHRMGIIHRYVHHALSRGSTSS